MSESQLMMMRRMTERELKYRIAKLVYTRDYYENETFSALVEELMRRH